MAESVKTLAWRYMMKAEPFGEASPERVDRLFAESLRSILRERHLLALPMSDADAGEDQITEPMRRVRGLGIDARKQIYLRDRIQDQQAWYAAKAAANARSEERLFWVMALAQLGALLAAIWLAVMPGLGLPLVGVLSTLAAGVLAWLQVKQHEELAQSYLVAAQELSLIATQGRHVHTDAAFSTFVADAEAAISREHTLWLARRDTLATS